MYSPKGSLPYLETLQGSTTPKGVCNRKIGLRLPINLSEYCSLKGWGVIVMQEFLLSLIDRCTSRTTAAIMFGAGCIVSLIDYLNATPKPSYIFTNTPGNYVMFFGFVTLIVRSLKKGMENLAANDELERRHRHKQETLRVTALSNFEVLDDRYKGMIKTQMASGKQRFHVVNMSAPLSELTALNIVIDPRQVGQPSTGQVFMIHPALWERRNEILNDYSIQTRHSADWYEEGRI